MGKDNWTTIGIPDELYNEVKTYLGIKEENSKRSGANSVSEYVRFWVRVGLRFDRASAQAPMLKAVVKELLRSLEEQD